MSKSNTAENDLMLLIFNKTLPSYLGTLTTTGNADLYVSLHTADPGEGGSQTTFEATYNTGAYGRVAVARTAGGWTVSGNQASNTALIQFALCTVGSDSILYVAVGTAASGAGQILYSGQLNSPRNISVGIQPQFSAGDLIFQED
jgi:hypothetical protein